MKKIILLFIIIGAFSSASKAQSRYRGNYPQHGSEKLGFRNISVGIGLYNPNLSYYKDVLKYDFSGAIGFDVKGEYYFAKLGSARVGAGIFNVTGKKVANSEWSAETKISTIPLSVDLLRHFKKDSRFALKPTPSAYFGISVQLTQLKLDYSSPTQTSNLSGGYIAVGPIAGFEYYVTTNFLIGPEVQYLIGSFNQGFIHTDGEQFEKKISMNGLKFGLRAAFVF